MIWRAPRSATSFAMNRRRSRSRGHLSLLALVVAFALLALGCPSGGGGSDGGGGGASGTCGSRSDGGGTPTATCGNGSVESGETCDDGNTNPGDGCSATCQTEPPPPPSGSAAVENVQSTAEWREGPTVPETDYHEMKLQTGHVDASSPGDHTLGFQNTRATGYMDYALILAVFSDGS